MHFTLPPFLWDFAVPTQDITSLSILVTSRRSVVLRLPARGAENAINQETVATASSSPFHHLAARYTMADSAFLEGAVQVNAISSGSSEASNNMFENVEWRSIPSPA